ncbi:MAG: hypothetical protein VB049_06980 [Candidatus Pelethousia sp.]|nr:hypothetical protein [Candidatus Pelethousia sp.]
MKSIFTRISLVFGALLVTSACAAPQSVSTAPSEPWEQQSAVAVEPTNTYAATAKPTLTPTPTVELTPTPEPTPKADSLLGSWTLVGTYDPEKWGWDVDKTKPLPEEKIDKAGEANTIVLKEDTLEDANSGETYKVKYDEQGIRADVEYDIFWQCSLVDKNQLFKFYGDTLSIYQRAE